MSIESGPLVTNKAMGAMPTALREAVRELHGIQQALQVGERFLFAVVVGQQ